MSAVVQIEQQLGVSIKDFDLDESMWSALTSSIFPGAKPESIIMAVEYARARHLDIMKKPCHIVPMSVKDSKTGQSNWRDVIMPSITEHRITATRTNQYAGQDAPVFGPMVDIKFGVVTHTVPEYCTVTIYRIIHGEKVPFCHTEYFEEACSTTKDGGLNSMWTKRKRGQLAKCAEAGALRKAFPEEIGNEYTVEEMQGKEITVGGSELFGDQKKIENDLIPVGYQEFEDTHLTGMRDLALDGMEALEAGYAELPKSKCRSHFWSIHKESLKIAAQNADNQQGEVYEHSPA
ncbi:phage recombination protein Bet [Acinetobacter silvestris]|uniref:Phage recombination protein Bet n=1 Tax=Acinetobacter silvestris TaxID=1977882 RepID=A0A1Y3CHF0_9GAMM|nr:phage recombination protein Bet [Acinetobacter silvestris]OTG65808.1 phage recombination protein Bet [Acinetobacter silvestris]